MNILIDRTRMGFCYRHPDMRTVFNLAHVELPNSHVIAFCEEDDAEVGHSAFETLSDLEVKLLYRNTTGETDLGLTSRQTVVSALYAAIAKLPITDADPCEASRQATFVLDREMDVYKYVKGSDKPRVMPDEWAPELLRSTDKVVNVPAREVPIAKATPKASTGGVKQHIRAMFEKAEQYTMEALTSDGRFSVASIKTALSDLKNEKYAGGEILVTTRMKIDGADYYVKG
jgi:hypothetical protein